MKRQRFEVIHWHLVRRWSIFKIEMYQKFMAPLHLQESLNIQRTPIERWRYSGNAYWLEMLITFHNCGEWVSPSGWPRSCVPSSRRTWHPRQVSWGIVFKETFDEITIWNRGIKKTYITDGWHHRWLDDLMVKWLLYCIGESNLVTWHYGFMSFGAKNGSVPSGWYLLDVTCSDTS